MRSRLWRIEARLERVGGAGHAPSSQGGQRKWAWRQPVDSMYPMMTAGALWRAFGHRRNGEEQICPLKMVVGEWAGHHGRTEPGLRAQT